MLFARTRHFNIPVSCTFELLPICNMQCRMCYIQKNREQMEREGKMLSCDEWLEIAEDLKESGILFLSLTGGEPLLFPEFERLYLSLAEMGFVLTMNTNGTLIDSHYADLFAAHPCRRINITVYGKDNETYGELCGNPEGFDQVTAALDLLRERNVPVKINYTPSPWNFSQLHDIVSFANEKDIPISCTAYVFPGNNPDARLTPEECAQCFIDVTHEKHPTWPMEVAAKVTLDKLKEPIHNKAKGYACAAGKNRFWVSWKGKLVCCGMMPHLPESLKGKKFMDVWNRVAPAFRELPVCQECENCIKRNVCPVCIASNYKETGSTSGRPQYICDVTNALIRKMLAYVSDEEREEYLELLKRDAQGTWS